MTNPLDEQRAAHVEALERLCLCAELATAFSGFQASDDREVAMLRDALRDAKPALAALTAPPLCAKGERAPDYVPGALDRTAPRRVWLQIDTSASNDERDEPWPGADHVTWQDESIGGLEIEYVRADLATTPAQPRREVTDADVTRAWGVYYSSYESMRAALESFANGGDGNG